MKLTKTVYFADGSSGIIEFEKPPGAHPDSMMAVDACIAAARAAGKIPVRICMTYFVCGLPIDQTIWRRP